MRVASFRATQALVVTAALLASSAPSFALMHARHAVRHTSASVRRVSFRKPVHHESAPGMDPDRATQIQTALIKQGYLSGSPTGVWDAQSVAAMQKMQADNGWQTKFTPDSRALIKLGLGGSDMASTALPGGQ